MAVHVAHAASTLLRHPTHRRFRQRLRLRSRPYLIPTLYLMPITFGRRSSRVFLRATRLVARGSSRRPSEKKNNNLSLCDHGLVST
jgi:hypothetical protein